MQDKIKNLIKEALRALGIGEVDFAVEHPEDFKNGDYSANVALVCGKNLKINPRELAEKITKELSKCLFDNEEIMKIDFAGVGFINFYLSREFFSDSVQEILKQAGDWGRNDSKKDQKIIIEHTQPNPFKEFHIGHLMNNAIGEAVSRIAKASSADIRTCTYHGDVGMHVAKALWAMLKNNSLLKEAYALGNRAFEEDENARKEIAQINKKIYDKSDSLINKIYKGGRETSFAHFSSLYKRLGSVFDFHFYESEAGEIGRGIILANLSNTKNNGRVFEESEGAIVFKGENFIPRTHTRVFLNSEHLPTYEGKEVGLAQIKKNIFPYDKSITITADEQDAFFNVVEVAIGEIFPELQRKLKHLSHGLLRLASGKMSSRSGNIITAEELLDQVKGKVKEKMADRLELPRSNFTSNDCDQTADIIALGAIKYSILRQSIGGDIIFDFDTSLSFEGDSGPYLQYSAIRAKSVLAKAKALSMIPDTTHPSATVSDLEKKLCRFPEVVLRASASLEPHHIVTYLTELASIFNSFYAKTQIINAQDQSSLYYLAMTQAFLVTMQNGLYLLGINIPERM